MKPYVADATADIDTADFLGLKTAALNVMSNLPSPFVELMNMDISIANQEELADSISRMKSQPPKPEYQQTRRAGKVNMLLVLVGGLSLLEVAAIRCLSQDPSFPYRIVMATTNLITGTSLLKTFID